MKSLRNILIILFLIVSKAYAFYVDAEFLYWQARNDNLEYALLVQTTPSLALLTGDAQKKNIGFNWNPGFRAILGCRTCCDFDIELIGTYLPTNAKGSQSSSTRASNEFLHNLWFQSFTGFRTGFAEANWHLDFATLDLIGKAHFYPLCCLHLIPRFGLRSVFIKQRYQVEYNDNLFSLMDGSPLRFPRADINLFSRYLAIGLLGGSDFEIPLRNNFSLKGGITASLVWGKVNVNERINGAFPLPEEILVPTQLSIHSHEYPVRANVEAETSLAYKTCWRGKMIEFSAGYIFSIWFDQNDFYNLIFTATNIVDSELQDHLPTIDKKYGNLQLQGLVLKTTVFF